MTDLNDIPTSLLLEMKTNLEAILEESDEVKAGRVLSAINKDKVREALNALQALLDASDDEKPEKSTSLSDGDPGAAELDAIISELVSGNEGFDLKRAEAKIDSLLERLKVKERR